jgi:hypothetical protein
MITCCSKVLLVPGVTFEADFNAAWSEGRAMTLEQALAYALDERRASSP